MSQGASSSHPIKFGGYYQPKDRPIEDLTARVGHGTPCGEYLRRFWHPIMLSSQLGRRPLAIRILGEDLKVQAVRPPAAVAAAFDGFGGAFVRDRAAAFGAAAVTLIVHLANYGIGGISHGGPFG